jgi:hypothetical protein
VTGDRRKHPREPFAEFDGPAEGDRRRLPRGPAAAHFRRLGEPAADPADSPPEAAPAAGEPAAAARRNP